MQGGPAFSSVWRATGVRGLRRNQVREGPFAVARAAALGIARFQARPGPRIVVERTRVESPLTETIIVE